MDVFGLVEDGFTLLAVFGTSFVEFLVFTFTSFFVVLVVEGVTAVGGTASGLTSSSGGSLEEWLGSSRICYRTTVRVS